MEKKLHALRSPTIVVMNWEDCFVSRLICEFPNYFRIRFIGLVRSLFCAPLECRFGMTSFFKSCGD